MSPQTSKKIAPKVIVVCAVALAILHQDVWWWDDKTLVFGFMPIGLAYHAFYSIMASVLWAAAVIWAWPTHIEEWADAGEDTEESKTGGAS